MKFFFLFCFVNIWNGILWGHGWNIGNVIYFLEYFMVDKFGYLLKFCFHDFKIQVSLKKCLKMTRGEFREWNNLSPVYWRLNTFSQLPFFPFTKFPKSFCDLITVYGNLQLINVLFINSFFRPIIFLSSLLGYGLVSWYSFPLSLTRLLIMLIWGRRRIRPKQLAF